jgi:hypothetical protein
LAGKDHDRNGIAICRSDAGNRVGGTWSRGDQGNSDVSLDPGIGIGSMDSGLLMTNKNVGYLFAFYQFIIDVDNRPAGKTENCLNSLLEEAFQQRLSTCHFHIFIPSSQSLDSSAGFNAAAVRNKIENIAGLAILPAHYHEKSDYKVQPDKLSSLFGWKNTGKQPD